MRILALTLAFATTATAAPPRPEIGRPPAAPQTVGALHTVRTIPEACIRLEGRFTGEPATPYRLGAVRTSPQCRPRARFVEAARGELEADPAWRLNDRILIPSATCPQRRAVVSVWRRPGRASPPALDAQGRARLYLDEEVRRAATAEETLPRFAATMRVEGGCR